MKNDAWYHLEKDAENGGIDYKDDIRIWYSQNKEIKTAIGIGDTSLDLDPELRNWTKPPTGRKEIVCPYEEGKARVGTKEFTIKYQPN